MKRIVSWMLVFCLLMSLVLPMSVSASETETTVPPTTEAATVPTAETLETESAEETAPVTEETVPVTEETVAVTEATVPVTEETVPATEETIPATEETAPAADKIQAMLETSGLLDASGQVLMLEDTVSDEAMGAVPMGAAAVNWIDRIANLPTYARNFYNWLVENSDGDGVNDCLIDPTTGIVVEGDEGTYYAELKHTTNNITTFTVDVNASEEEITAIIDEALARDCNAWMEDVSAYTPAVYGAFMRDYPEVFWLSGGCTWTLYMENASVEAISTDTFQVTYGLCAYFVLLDPEFDIRHEDYRSASAITQTSEERDNAVVQIISGAAGSRYEQVRYLNEWLTTHNCYNSSSNLNGIGVDCRSCISALTGSIGTAGPVCEGYASAFKVLCDELGIPCVLVDGVSDGENHMWNYVRMEDGNWYAVDVTWNDPTVAGVSSAVSGYENEDYLLVGSSTLVDGRAFGDSHIVQNTPMNDGSAFTNGPTLAQEAYEPAGEHTHSWQDATCIAPKTCKVCGETEGNALGHSYEAVVIAPTCVDEGYITHTCAVCGDSYVDSKTEATGIHNYVNNVCECGAIGGTCGEELTWEFDAETGTLTISGSGKMKDFLAGEESKTPWGNMLDKIRVVELAEGVTSIGSGAFANCTSLTTLTIPGNVTSIGEAAFWGSGLISMEIPDGVTRIDGYAFTQCSALTEVTIPKSVTSIGQSAFSSCTSLTSVNIPEGVARIEDHTFTHCTSLTDISLPSTITGIGEGAFNECSSLTALTLPESVTSIGDYAFDGCSGLTSLQISEGVTEIGWQAFYNCSSLTSLELPESVTTIGDYAFIGCDNLTTLILPSKVTDYGENAFCFMNCAKLTEVSIPEGVTAVPETAFYGCSSLASVTLPEGMTSIGNRAFYDCHNLTSITIPESVVSIGNGAFYGCAGLTNIHFKGDAPEMQAYPFESTTTTVYYPANNPTWTEDVMQDYGGDITWKAYCEAHTEVIDEAVAPTCVDAGLTEGKHCSACDMVLVEQKVVPATGVHSYVGTVCEHCGAIGGICGDNLTWTLENGMLTISGTGEMYDYGYQETAGAYAPWNIYRESIVSVEIENGVQSVGNYAFYGCVDLSAIVIPNGVESIGEYAFSECGGLTAVEIPETVSEIGEAAFYWCKALKSVSLPDAMKELPAYLFYGCASMEKVQLPSGIVEIPEYTFGFCNQLQEVEIPADVTKVDQYAFTQCHSLSELELPENLKEIGQGAFFACLSLESCTIPDSVVTVGHDVFNGCSSLLNVTLSANMTSIPANFFMGCEKLERIELHNKITEIGFWSFWGCSELARIVMPSSIVSIDMGAFYNCSSLTEIIFEGDVPVFLTQADVDTFAKESDAFYGVTAIAYYPASNPTWTSDVMQDYGGDLTWKFYCDVHTEVIDKAVAPTCVGTGLTEGKHCSDCGMVLVEQKVVPATGVHSYVGTVCEHCGAIGGICGEDLTWTLVDGVLTISGTGEMAYFVPWEDYADQVTALVIEPGATTISYNAFRWFKQLKEVAIADTVTIIGSCAFLSCTSLETVDIPASVKVIDDNAFAGCKKLSTVTLHEGLTTIGPVAFEGCEKLSQIEIPESVTAIGEMVFSNCKALTTIHIPSGVTTIEAYTFQNSGLTNITIPDTVTTIKKLAFAWCNDLTSVTIPKSVTEIGETAFAYCGNLKEITFRGDVPAIAEDAFATITADAYYPEENDTWTSDVMQDYGGDITWCSEKKIETTPMYRLYNPNSGEHFYTGSVEERDMLVEAGWNYEGIAWNAPIYEGTPVYRVFNPNSGDHHYTMSQEEVDMLVDVGWRYEGVAWNSASSDHVPQQRLYNPNADCGSHHYTSSQEELDFLVSLGWIHEGIGWFGIA